MGKRIALLKAQHEIIVHINNEEAYMEWINIVPDCPQDDDFEFIAENEELFADAMGCFKEIMNTYLDDGIYIGNTLY